MLILVEDESELCSLKKYMENMTTILKMPETSFVVHCSRNLLPRDLNVSSFSFVVSFLSENPPDSCSSYQQGKSIVENGRGVRCLWVFTNESSLRNTQNANEWQKVFGRTTVIGSCRRCWTETDTSLEECEVSVLARLSDTFKGTVLSNVINAFMWDGLEKTMEVIQVFADSEKRLLTTEESDAMSMLGYALEEKEAGVFPEQTPVKRALKQVLNDLHKAGVPYLIVVPDEQKVSAISCPTEGILTYSETREYTTRIQAVIVEAKDVQQLLPKLDSGRYAGVIILGSSGTMNDKKTIKTTAELLSCFEERRHVCCNVTEGFEENWKRYLSSWAVNTKVGTDSVLLSTVEDLVLPQSTDSSQQMSSLPSETAQESRPNSPSSALFCSVSCVEDEWCKEIVEELQNNKNIDVIPRVCLECSGKRLFNVGPSVAVLLWTDSDMDGEDSGTGMALNDIVLTGFDATRASQFAKYFVIVKSRSLKRLTQFTTNIARIATPENVVIRVAVTNEEIVALITEIHNISLQKERPKALFFREESPWEIFLEHIGWDPFSAQTMLQKHSCLEILSANPETVSANKNSEYLYQILKSIVQVEFSRNVSVQSPMKRVNQISSPERTPREQVIPSSPLITSPKKRSNRICSTDDRLDMIMSRSRITGFAAEPPQKRQGIQGMRLSYDLPVNACRGQTRLRWVPIEKETRKTDMRYAGNQEQKEPVLKKKRGGVVVSEEKQSMFENFSEMFGCSESEK